MRIDIFDQSIELEPHRSIVLHDAGDAQVTCTRGRIWVTEDPLCNDIVLDPGASHRIGAPGKVFVTAVYPSTVLLQEPTRAAVRPSSPGLLERLTAAIRLGGARRRYRMAA